MTLCVVSEYKKFEEADFTDFIDWCINTSKLKRKEGEKLIDKWRTEDLSDQEAIEEVLENFKGKWFYDNELFSDTLTDVFIIARIGE